MRSARFILDSGGGGLIFDEGLARDLGLKPEGAIIFSDGQEYRRVNVPEAFEGGMPVDLRISKAFVHLGTTRFTNRDTLEGLLPGKAFEHYQIVRMCCSFQGCWLVT